ncbi:nucleotidyltransferase family protein [Streptococcus cuniculi]|nr:nucleotidyltransferase family protein [Streptococcus cuniculi]MBF0779100.1 nucleotidyltransferase family protein [Streptococcus cuniculi]
MTENELKEQLLADRKMREVLEIVARLQLQDVWVCAGTIRNFIWNLLSSKDPFDEETDVDVVFYDPTSSYEETILIEENLRRSHPAYRWEVKNQVYMHQHNPKTSPYESSCDAISKFPETCTAIAARLLPDCQVELFCPYGLGDLLDFKICPTPHFVAHPERMKVYRERLDQKGWKEKWEKLQLLHVEDIKRESDELKGSAAKGCYTFFK